MTSFNLSVWGCLLLWVGLGWAAHAQAPKADSLLALLPSRGPKEQVALLNQVAGLYLGNNPKKSLTYAQQAQQLAQQANDPLGQAVAHNTIGECYLAEGNYRAAQAQVALAMAAAQQAGDSLNWGIALAKQGSAHFLLNQLDSALLSTEQALPYLRATSPADEATALNLMSYAHGKRNQYLKAIEYHVQALEIRKRLDDLTGIAKSYNSLGDFYMMQGNLAKALEHYYSSLLTSQATHNPKGEAISLNNIGFVQAKQGAYKEAARNLHHALWLKERMGNLKETAITVYNLGVLHYHDRQYDSALFYLQKALDMRQKLNDNFGEAVTLTALGRAQMAKGNFAASLAHHQRAIAIAEQTKALPIMADSYAGMAEAYLRMDKPVEFMQYYKRQLALQDTVNARFNSARIAELQEKLENDKKRVQEEREMAARRLREAEKRRQELIIFSLAGFIALLLVLGLLLYRFLQLRNRSGRELAERNQKIEAQNLQLSASQAELKKMNEAKDRFFSIVAHDLRSPMASLNGLLKLLKNSGIDLSREDSALLVGEISEQLDCVTVLLNNLLHWARNQMTQVSFKPETVSVQAAGSKVVSLLAIDASAKHLRLAEKLPPDLQVRADPNMVDFIFRNLVANAIKFTPPGGEVLLLAEPAGEFIKILVRDTGVGIPKGKSDEIFDPLKHSHTTGTAGETGSGLGLSLCKEFVERHGGQIWAVPNQPTGTVFGFTLPRG
jgi:two-component system, sensor histidine kinase and response regulator